MQFKTLLLSASLVWVVQSSAQDEPNETMKRIWTVQGRPATQGFFAYDPPFFADADADGKRDVPSFTSLPLNESNQNRANDGIAPPGTSPGIDRLRGMNIVSGADFDASWNYSLSGLPEGAEPSLVGFFDFSGAPGSEREAVYIGSGSTSDVVLVGSEEGIQRTFRNSSLIRPGNLHANEGDELLMYNRNRGAMELYGRDEGLDSDLLKVPIDINSSSNTDDSVFQKTDVTAQADSSPLIATTWIDRRPANPGIFFDADGNPFTIPGEDSSSRHGIVAIIVGLLRDENLNDPNIRAQGSEEKLVVMDSETLGTVWEYPLPNETSGRHVEFLGLYDFEGNGRLSALVAIRDGKWAEEVGENACGVRVIDTTSNVVELSFDNVLIGGVADFDDDGLPELMLGKPDRPEVRLFGWTLSDDLPPILPAKARLDLTVSPYQLSLKYESEPGQRLALDPRVWQSVRNLDINSDGISDVAMLIDDSNGPPSGMEVLNGRSLEIEWAYTFPQENLDDILEGFRGFHDVDGDGINEAYFGHNIAVTLDHGLHLIAEDFVLRAIIDLDQDGFPELIGENRVRNTVEVWGKVSTSPLTE